jgi:hypothetical protein
MTLSTTVRIRPSLSLSSAVREATTRRSDRFHIKTPTRMSPPNKMIAVTTMVRLI